MNPGVSGYDQGDVSVGKPGGEHQLSWRGAREDSSMRGFLATFGRTSTSVEQRGLRSKHRWNDHADNPSQNMGTLQRPVSGKNCVTIEVIGGQLPEIKELWKQDESG